MSRNCAQLGAGSLYAGATGPRDGPLLLGGRVRAAIPVLAEEVWVT